MQIIAGRCVRALAPPSCSLVPAGTSWWPTAGQLQFSCSVSWWRSAVPPCRHLATVAEEFDVIRQDVGLVRIDGCVPGGFLVGENEVRGNVLASGGLLTSWSVRSVEDITEESLAILDLIKPAPDLLVLGVGETTLPPPRHVVDILAKKHMTLDASPTASTASAPTPAILAVQVQDQDRRVEEIMERRREAARRSRRRKTQYIHSLETELAQLRGEVAQLRKEREAWVAGAKRKLPDSEST